MTSGAESPGRTSRPSIDDSVELMKEMAALWREHFPRELPVFESSPSRGFALLAHVEHAAALTRGVAALAESGMYIQTVPLIRMTMECAVTAAWYATAEGSADAGLYEATRLRRALSLDLRRLAPDGPDALDDLEESLRELEFAQSEEARKFEVRCRSFERGEWLYFIYRQLSESAHGGTLLLEHYLQLNPAADYGFELVTEDDSERAATHLGLQAWMLHVALTTWTSVMKEPALETALSAIAAKEGFSSTLRRRVD